MAVENHDGPFLAAGQALQPPEQIDLLARVQLLAEPARLAERRRIAKDKRPRGPLVDSAQRIPHSDPDSGQERGSGVRILEGNGASPCETSRTDGARGLAKKLHAGIRICIHEKDPVPAGAGGAGVARAAYLVDRLRYDLGSRRYSDLRRAVGGIVVAHDQLRFPAEPVESPQGRAHAGERPG